MDAQPLEVSGDRRCALLVTDIDNTIFDWVTYYVTAFDALLELLSETIGVSVAQLAGEAKGVFAAHGSIEYPFLVQELPSVLNYYGDDIDRMLHEAVEKFLRIHGVVLTCAIKRVVFSPTSNQEEATTRMMAECTL